MFKTLQNTVSIDFTLVPEGPVLVRAQSVGLDPGIADMEFQRTTRGGRRTVFLAGSGLKGVLRAHVERLLRSAGRFACDPTKVRDPGACGHFRRRLGQEYSEERPHAGQCGACFTFGSLKLAGRFRIGDALPTADLWKATNTTEVRAGVGIDRKSQGASTGVLYDAEVVVDGGFATRLTGENFSLWQVGAVLQALHDLDAGFLQIGGCKSRGMGAVRVRDLEVRFRFLVGSERQLTGVLQKGADFNYGLPPEDEIPVGGGKEEGEGLFRCVRYGADTVFELCKDLMKGPFRRYGEKGN